MRFKVITSNLLLLLASLVAFFRPLMLRRRVRGVNTIRDHPDGALK